MKNFMLIKIYALKKFMQCQKMGWCQKTCFYKISRFRGRCQNFAIFGGSKFCNFLRFRVFDPVFHFFRVLGQLLSTFVKFCIFLQKKSLFFKKVATFCIFFHFFYKIL